MANILCTGILVSDTIVKPVHRDIFGQDTARVSELFYTSGGDAMNQALTLCHLGNQVAIAGAVGADAAGDRLLATLKEAGIDASHVQRSNTAGTACSIVLCEEDGERHVLYYPGANEAFYMPQCGDLSNYDMLAIGSLYSIPKMDREGFAQLLPQAKQQGVKVLADMTENTAGTSREAIAALLPYIDVLCPSLLEGQVFTGQTTPETIIRAFWAEGASTVVLKAGKEGCYVGEKDTIQQVPTYLEAPVVDTTGAGDSFTAGLIHGLLKGLPLAESACFACAVGSVAVGALGATTAVRSERQILDFMQQYPDT